MGFCRPSGGGKPVWALLFLKRLKTKKANKTDAANATGTAKISGSKVAIEGFEPGFPSSIISS